MSKITFVEKNPIGRAPRRVHSACNNFYLYNITPTSIGPGETETIQLGYGINLPNGFYATLEFNSCPYFPEVTATKEIIASPGIEELTLTIHNDSSLHFPIRKDEKIATAKVFKSFR